MKSSFQNLSLCLLLAPLAPLHAIGQDETRPAAPEGKPDEAAPAEEVSTATGTIFSLDAVSISLTPENSAIPLVFEITNATSFVDETDKKVAKELVLTGIGATVHYVPTEKKFVALKIVVTRKTLAGSGPESASAATRRRAELTETKELKDEAARSKSLAEEGGGTLMGFEQIIAVRVAGEATMTQYTVTNATLFVDSVGNPVPPHVVRTGAGLKVQYVEDAGRKLATTVTVQSMPAWVREGLRAAESGTSPPGSTAAGTTSGRTTTSNNTTGNMADGFIYQPVVSLPGGQAADTFESNPSGQPNSANDGSRPNQPNANRPNGKNQPNEAGQANTTPPNQPKTNQPNPTVRPDSSPGRAKPTGRDSNPSPSSPAQPATPPATTGTK